MLNDAAIARFDALLEEDIPEQRRRWEALWDRDPEALQRVNHHAVRCGDLKTIIVTGEILDRHNALGREAAHGLAQALLTQGRHEAALRAFGHRKLQGFSSPKYHLGLGQTLAALGRPDDAMRAAETALRLKPDYAGAAALRDELLEPAPLQPLADEPEADALLESADLKGAIAGLGRLAEERKHDAGIRGALAYCVGRKVVKDARPTFARGRTGRIVNLVLFSNEFTLLRMRLEEMAPWVDRFVIVEAGETFTGQPKPLHFQAAKDQFADFADRIVHLPLPAFPGWLTSPWAREFYQRDMGIAAASGLAGEDDYILETDADEIVDGKALEGFEGDFAGLQMRVSRFFLNYRPDLENRKRLRRTSSIFKARHLTQFGVSFARFVLARRWGRAYVIPDAGWHFTSVADAAGISAKIDSYAHQEQTKRQFRDEGHFHGILERIRAGEAEPGWERCPLDETFPAYIRRHREELAGLIL